MNRVKLELEFLFKGSPATLYKFFTEPARIVLWFCDEVDIQGDVYTFSWNGSEEIAVLIDDIEDERLRFKWVEGPIKEEYLEFRFLTAEVTNETILEITDFCDADEKQDQEKLWINQASKLKIESGG
jgi:uncharacterized protein YndB with AHSA1/START domain